MTQKTSTSKAINHKSNTTSSTAIKAALKSQSPLSPQERLLQLHRQYGNKAVQRMYESRILQAKLKIGSPNDKYEQEADLVAARVMSIPDPQIRPKLTFPFAKGSQGVDEVSSSVQMPSEYKPIQTKSRADQITPLVQRQTEPEEEENAQVQFLQRQEEEEEVQKQPEEEEQIQVKMLQPQAEEEEEEPAQAKMFQRQEREEDNAQAKNINNKSGTISSNVENNINTIRGGGQPLSESTRSFFEPRFGAYFRGVRTHTGSNADHLAKSINAKAFTVGQDIVFGSGQYSPDSRTGRSLLAHELTHVVQQNYSKKGRVMRKPSCLYPTYPGMGGLPHRGATWYPHDFVGPIQSGDVQASKSNVGYDVPSSSSSLYNCMRWAVGHGVPTSREWWQGVPRTSSVPWPEEKFLKDKGCRKIRAAGKSDHKVKLYEYKHEDQFHIVRQEADGAWSSKIGTGPLYRGITKPDVHTAGHYKPMSEMKPTYWSCP